jgi:hypothetical protein
VADTGTSNYVESSANNVDDHASPLPPPVIQPDAPTLGVRTRLQQGIRNPKQYTDGTIRYGMFSSTAEPTKLSEALCHGGGV